MKRQLLLGAAILGSVLTTQAQTVLIEDGFETYDDFVISDFGNWLTIDLDGSETYTGGGGTPWETANEPQAYIIFNPGVAGVTNATTGTELRNFDPHGGEKYAGSWAAVMPAQDGTGPNDDWLVSPPVNLGATSNELTFWVKSLSSSYGLERYQVGIYVGSGTPGMSSDFTVISGATSLTAPYPNWELKTFSLDAYANQTVRVGIHCVSSDAYFFMVDDFKVTTATIAGINDNLSSLLSVYPNPATNVINISNKNQLLVNGITLADVNGRTVKQLNAGDVAETQINVSDLAPGIYIMTISSDKGSMTKKIVKN